MQSGTTPHLGGKGGQAISPYYPYSCNESYYGNPAFPGNRLSAIEAYGPGKTVLASQAAYQTAFAGVEVIYPVDATATAINLQQPQALAISGLNKKVYVADTQAGKVYSTAGSGVRLTLTPVSTGTITLSRRPRSPWMEPATCLLLMPTTSTAPGPKSLRYQPPPVLRRRW